MPNRLAVTFLVVLFAVVGVAMHFAYPILLQRICQEDGVVETFTALLYLTASALFVMANGQTGSRNIWMWGYVLLFLLVAGEEISWGQRALGLETPAALASVNVQEETNFHNIEGIHGSIRAMAVLVIFAICFVLQVVTKS